MSAQLIQHLKDVCKENEAVKILLSQWEFDSLLVSKALENIGSYYPHFSNHNSSHSKQILTNIERILGKDIDKLSATDTWLILEAAYWHDIGMLVDSKSAKDLQGNEDFKFMVKDIAKRKNHDLNEFAKIFDEQGWSAAICSMSHPFDGVQKYRQLIAEWFRTQHANRVGGIIQDPFDILGINSPRTELLPKRIYSYLGQICMAHGTSFEKVMENLPYRQTGLGTENCHPRFVACLLRLGDLFDLDDNRFCPVMLKQVGQMPEMSHTHLEKHLSIREFQLDRDTVKVITECPNEMAYVETQQWFDWIRQEFQNQMSNWKLIAPNRDFGLLPTLEQLNVHMTDSKILLDNKPMKFSLDEENVIEILEGSGIYKDNTNIYRELIQNAIDATLMRVWLQHSESDNHVEKLPKISHPFESKTRNILNKYPIFIDFNKIRDIDGSDDSLWEFTLKDQGMGISLNDLHHMQKIAGSSNNKERQKIIEAMPKWMRPSGQFGIGMHSAFLLMKDLPDDEQKIVLTTKSFVTNKSYEIELYSPLCRKKGYCFIKELDKKNSPLSWGTTLKFKIKKTRRGKKYNFNQSMLYQHLEKNYDPLLEEAFDRLSVATTIDDIVDKVLQSTPIPATFGEFWQKNLITVYGDSILNSYEKVKNFVWIESYQLYFEVSPSQENLANMSGQWNAWFKGQHVDRISTGTHNLFDFSIIFYGLQAKDSLNIDRNDWKNKFVETLQDDNFFQKLGFLILKDYRNKLKDLLVDDMQLSLFDYFYDPQNRLNLDDREKWKDLPMFSKKNSFNNFNEKCNLYGATFNELLNKDNFSIIESRSINKLTEVFDENSLVVDFGFYGWSKIKFEELWYNLGGTISVEKSKIFDKYSYIKLENSQINIINYEIIRDFKYFLQNPSKRKFYNEEWLSHSFFEEFKPLFSISRLTVRLTGNSENFKVLILPFLFENIIKKTNKTTIKSTLIIKVDHQELIAKNSWEARDNEFEQMTQDEFIELYKKLITKIDNLFVNDETWTKARTLEQQA